MRKTMYAVAAVLGRACAIVLCGLGWLYFRVLNRVRINGERMFPRGAIFYSNHQNIIDGFLINMGIIGFPRMIRDKATLPYSMVTRRYDERLPRLRWLFRALRLVSVQVGGPADKRREVNEAVNQFFVERLRSGERVLIFPEGRLPVDGSLGEFYPGAARLALMSGAPVVPVALRGTAQLIPSRGCVPRVGKNVVVTIGTPLTFEQMEKPGKEEINAITRALRARLEELLNAP
ncbi:MAG: hypothetical protein A2939_05330 [Parcubacteria group bacterium RIFCSPLOWO2_01_FULL_48_18]|nr:MAG: hypothetical protein A3J67_06640 [Parcubacteria group bacterium RIFCSPHIGHO2_02_FULL_48_10b]OHB22521.1 MAG: hypothetical protein A2939_05330 [Parcubacteria group bacterium RIFCSPLOWO2_01_FULL_48_18]